MRFDCCRALLFLSGLLLSLAGCAAVPADPEDRAEYEATNDPAEPTNRAIFDANQYVDRNVIKPVAVAYRDNVSDGVRRSVHNLMTTLREPIVTVNDLLQGNGGQAWTSWWRFVINMTVGGVGLFDAAADSGLEHHDSDFGQTFGVWGISEGPYVQLPILGPSNPRDAIGLALTFLLDPLNFFGQGAIVADITYARAVTDGVDKRTNVLPFTESVEKTSIDPYAEYRSVYRQYRAAMIRRGAGATNGEGGTGTDTDQYKLHISGSQDGVKHDDGAGNDLKKD